MTDEESPERMDEPERGAIDDLPRESATVTPLPTDPSKIGRQLDGRFAPGNNANPTGRPLGSKHKATLAIEALLEGEAEKLTRKAVELALAGDTTALRLCLERLVPPAKSRRVSIDLPKLEVPTALECVNSPAKALRLYDWERDSSHRERLARKQARLAKNPGEIEGVTREMGLGGMQGTPRVRPPEIAPSEEGKEATAIPLGSAGALVGVRSLRNKDRQAA